MVARIAARGRDGKLLCVVAAVLDLMPLLAEAQFDAAPGLVLTLRNENGRVLAGPPAPAGSEPVTIEVLLPDRRWKIEAWPAAGWSAAGALRLLAFRGRALVLCLLLSTLAWLLASQQAARARAREERTRHAADERFARLYQLIPDGVSLMRLPAEEIIEVNDAYLALSGYTRAELVGHTALEVGLWEDLPERERVGESLRKDGVVRAHPIRLRRKDGRVVEVDGSFRLFELEGEQCILGIIRDMTGARSLQLQLLQAQKMEAVGTLAGGVAHDFNNIISVILSYAELASQELPPGSTVRDDLEQIGEASKRAATLVRQLLAFSHRQVVEPRAVDVSAQAARTLRLLERVLPSDIKVETALPEGLTPVLVDPGHLEQVLMNLAVNARDAMPDGGKLEIRTSCEGEEVVLSVRDTGRGIPEQLQSRIFEPFFTTKPAGKGTGLGLATCYGIVKQAGGRIELRSAPGEGSTFRVLLPALRDSAPLRTTPEQLAAPPRGTETILLAEDEPQLRAATERMLSGLGYRVIAAADGAEALALARAHDGSIALLVTDVMMPGLRGPELAGQLRKEMPSVRTLFISGYADAAALELARQDGAGYLGKPFTLERLAAAVREQLDRR